MTEKQMTTPRRLGTVKETCSYARCSRTKLYDYVNEGKIVAYKRDGRTLIDLDSVDAFNSRSLVRIAPKKKPRRDAGI